jgi:hypothetical protein
MEKLDQSKYEEDAESVRRGGETKPLSGERRTTLSARLDGTARIAVTRSPIR